MVPSMVKPRKFIIISLAVFMAALSAEAQSFREEIAENPDRAGTIFHYYEYATSPMTKVPRGYKPFYISHYGRHGSRYHSAGSIFKDAKVALDSARKTNMLTEEGIVLSLQLDTLWDEHMRMFGMLSVRGMEEHRAIASRMFQNFEPVFSGERNEINCISSYFPRCIMSMENFTTSLLDCAAKANIGSLNVHYVAGQKYFAILCAGATPTKEIGAEGAAI